LAFSYGNLYQKTDYHSVPLSKKCTKKETQAFLSESFFMGSFFFVQIDAAIFF